MKNSGLIYGIEKITEKQERQLAIPGQLGKSVDTKNIYEKITEKVIEIMESSEDLPWRQPWKTNENGDINLPSNFSTKKNYRGINVFFLGLHMSYFGWDNPYFLTYNQAVELKGQVRPGSKGIPVVFYTKSIYRHVVTKKTILAKVYDALPPAQQVNYEASWTLKQFFVFHASMIEGIDWGTAFLPKEIEHVQRIENCEKILREAPNLPPIAYGGADAYYVPAQDRIQVPRIDTFISPEFFYSVLFHEIVHATGSPNRLDREEKKKRKNWGDSYYAYEELIAEMGAAYLDGVAGIEYATLKNSASYVKSWKKGVTNELANDPKFFFNACGDAQKAADYVLGELPKEVYKKFKPIEPAEPKRSDKPEGKRAREIAILNLKYKYSSRNN